MVANGVLSSFLVLGVLFLMVLTGVVAPGGKNGQADRPSSSSSRGWSNVGVSTDEERKSPVSCFAGLFVQKKSPNESTSHNGNGSSSHNRNGSNGKSKKNGRKLSFSNSKKKFESTYSGGDILNPSSPNSMPSHRDPYTGLLKD
nr:PREDICTED: uncharacterized protein LOC109038363 [Bemisia tabaci]